MALQVSDNNEEDQDGLSSAASCTTSASSPGTGIGCGGGPRDGSLFCIQEHPDYGRYVVATDRISPAGLVIDESPVMCAPWPIDEAVTFEEPLCLGCCMLMRRGTGHGHQGQGHGHNDDDDDDGLTSGTSRHSTGGINRCSKCQWPVCSVACEQLSLHRDNECQLFVETKMPYPPPGDNMNIVTASVLIQLIRCLLVKKHRPQVWTENLLKLQCETSLGTLPWNFHLLLDDIRDIFPELEESLGNRDECCKLLSIININAFSNTFNHNGEFSGCSICLFVEASMLAHSCTPNCWWTLTEDPSHRIIIKAGEEISKGSMISVCYSNQYSVFGTMRREEMFRNVGGFTCKCRRCTDPSELGSNVSAVLCENCMIGYKLPEIPTDNNTRWKCDLCGHLESSEMIEGIIKALETRLESIIVEKAKPVPLLVRFLENCKTLVHNNHWIVTQTEDAIMKEWARDPDVRFGGSTPQEIVMTCEYYVSLCFHVLSVRNIVSPGLSFHRARYLLFFARSRMALLEFLISLLEESHRHRVLFTSNISSFLSDLQEGGDEVSKSRRRQIQFQSLRQEFQEILLLYHEVMEYRRMSTVADEEIRGEIEHLIKLVTPIVQMEPHHRLIQEIIREDDGTHKKGTRDALEKGQGGGQGGGHGDSSNDDGAGCTLS